MVKVTARSEQSIRHTSDLDIVDSRLKAVSWVMTVIFRNEACLAQIIIVTDCASDEFALRVH